MLDRLAEAHPGVSITSLEIARVCRATSEASLAEHQLGSLRQLRLFEFPTTPKPDATYLTVRRVDIDAASPTEGSERMERWDVEWHRMPGPIIPPALAERSVGDLRAKLALAWAGIAADLTFTFHFDLPGWRSPLLRQAKRPLGKLVAHPNATYWVIEGASLLSGFSPVRMLKGMSAYVAARAQVVGWPDLADLHGRVWQDMQDLLISPNKRSAAR